MARALRRAVRYGRDQQHLLSAARRRHIRRLAPPCAARIPLRGQSEPVPDAHEEAEGSGLPAAAVLLARDSARRNLRSGSVSAAAAMAGEPGALRAFFERAAARAASRDRVSRAELVQRRRLRADAEAS